MLITPRTYSASQTADQGHPSPGSESEWRFYSLAGWRIYSANANQPVDMPLIHQAGSVRVGEVVRYTFSYDPAADTEHPPPSELHVKIKNTSAIPLRAAYLHGPYTLYASCYPSTFDPNVGSPDDDTSGTPQFEPYLKAGGSWRATIPVPKRRGDTGDVYEPVTWRIEIISQVIFSSTASVNFELLIGRDQKSVETGGFSNSDSSRAARLRDHWLSTPVGEQVLATKGVYSKAVKLLVDDTASLWNTPRLPACEEERGTPGSPSNVPEQSDTADTSTHPPRSKPKKKVHLVVLTHGLHSNLGADMLYLKESIDASVQKGKQRKKEMRRKRTQDGHDDPTAHRTESGDGASLSDDTDDDDEQVIVRGFSGNAVRTERGIQYLGKRLAKYILFMTYPDQPYLPRKNSKSKPWSQHSALSGDPTKEQPFGERLISDTHGGLKTSNEHPYQITSISFIGHSLGGLIQTYAIAYIQKHSPEFFNTIRPVNFIALATPFLGLSNENPMYVKFALDLGLVGRTGQDLGLSWTAPRVRSGWEAIIGGKGDPVKSQNYADAGSKPLLRILPCGPAHEVLAKFQYRTIYSNVVNDGIVPLRTSCLLFLDWKGLDRVEKARRDNGIVGTMAEWGWAELTGANSKSPRSARPPAEIRVNAEGGSSTTEGISVTAMPSQHNATQANTQTLPSEEQASLQLQKQAPSDDSMEVKSRDESIDPTSYSPLNSFFSIFKSKPATKNGGHKQTKILKRSQTLGPPGNPTDAGLPSPSSTEESLARDHLYDEYGLHAPPKTTFFESASDLLLPPLPPTEFITDPGSRPRTIFHDRVYHPDDVPMPLPPKRRTMTFGQTPTKPSDVPPASPDRESTHSHLSGHENESGLKIEEKIARAYHRDLSWRKVLVRLEPDAHNNIIVRRMFTNAYGWPVVQHLVDTHFGPDAVHDDLPGNTTEGFKSLVINTGDNVEHGHEHSGIP